MISGLLKGIPMNCLDLLKGYKSIPIKVEDTRFLLQANKDILLLNEELFSLIASCKFDKYQLLKYMRVTPSGIILDLTILKRELMKYFAIVDTDCIIDRLSELESAIKN